MKNIKDLFDPETYTEKIKELAPATTKGGTRIFMGTRNEEWLIVNS